LYNLIIKNIEKLINNLFFEKTKSLNNKMLDIITLIAKATFQQSLGKLYPKN